MGVSWMVARVELRRRWSSLLGLAVLVALVSGVVLTALAGAYRTSTSIDRFRDWAGASDVTYQASGPETADVMQTALEARPEVEAASTRYLVNAFPEDASVPDIAIMADPRGTFGYEVDRPRLLAGRLPDGDAPDELLLNELAARLTGWGVGDTIRAQTWSPDDLEALFSSPDFPGFNGPRLDLQVVGIGRTPDELPGDVRRTGPYAIASPAFLSSHPDVGAWPPAVVARLAGGATVEATTAGLSRDLEDEPVLMGLNIGDMGATTADEVYLDTTERTVDGLAVGLLVFAASAGLAGAIAVGQAISRQLAGSGSSVRSLGALGLTRSETALALSRPIVASGVVGVAAGGALSVLASPLLPMGLARRAEVDQGVWISPAILVPGAVLILGVVTAWSFHAARRPVLAKAVSSGGRGSVLARTVTRSGASPVLTTGIRLASDRGRGSGAVPVRSAFFGVTIGVAGVLGAGVIAASLDELSANPSHWGWNWSSLPDYFGDGDISELEARIIEDERIEAVGDFSAGSADLDGTVVTANSMAQLRGTMAYTTLSGRLPSGPGEVALGRQTLQDLGVSVGDTVDALTADGSTTREVTVVGTVVIPPSDEYRLDVGAVFTPEGAVAYEQGDPLSTLALRYPEGVDVEALEAELAADYGLEFTIFAKPQTPGSIRNLAEGRDIAWALAAFFVVIGAAGLFHALLISTRRRRGDLAVLRALGFRRPQVRAAIVTQALALTAAGVVVGVPIGLVVGRLAWRALVDSLGVVSDPQTPWVLIAAIIPIAFLVAALVAVWPARMAVHDRPGVQLRAE